MAFTDGISNLSKFSKDSLEILSCLKDLISEVRSLLKKTFNEVNNLHNAAIKEEYKLNCVDLSRVYCYAHHFYMKVIDLFEHGQNEEQIQWVKEALKSGNSAPLKEYLDQLRHCADQVDECYQEYESAYNKAQKVFLKVAKNCKLKVRKAKIGRKTTQYVGAAAGFVVGSVAVYTGVFTFGVTTAAGVCAFTAISAAGVGLVYRICSDVKEYEEANKSFTVIAANNDGMLRISKTINDSVCLFQTKVKALVEIMDDCKIEIYSNESLFFSFNLLTSRFTEYLELTAPCGERMHELEHLLTSI